MDSINSKISTYRNNLSKLPVDLNELTFVLNTILEIWSTSEDTEVQYRDVAESYRTLLMYNIEIDANEVNEAYSLADQWNDLLSESKKVDNDLIPVKIKFAETTQVSTFKFDFLEPSKRI